MHNDQMTEVKDHLRLPSLGENVDITVHNRRDTKISSIPQIDGIVDSRDSPSITPESVDLTVSPEKHRNDYFSRRDKDTDTNDKDMDETFDFDKETSMRTYRKDRNRSIDRKKNDENDIHKNTKTNKGKTNKVYEMNEEKKKLLRQRREKAIQNAKDRETEKACTRVNKSSKANQDTKMLQKYGWYR